MVITGGHKECCARSTSQESRSSRGHSYRRGYDAERRSHSRDYYPDGRIYDRESVEDSDKNSHIAEGHPSSSSFVIQNLCPSESDMINKTARKNSENAPSEPLSQMTGDKEAVEGEKILNKPEAILREENELSAEIVKMFGDCIMPDRVLAPAVHKDLAIRWEDNIEKGLPSEERKTLLKKFPPPENCTAIDPPKMNLEVKSALESTVVKKDERIAEKQTKIAATIAGIAKTLTSTLKGDPENKMGLVEHLSGVARLLADLQRDETMVRRSLILKNIKTSYRDTLKNTSWDEELFGKSLAEKLKSSKVLQQSSKDLKSGAKSQTENKQSKNSRGPPRWNQQKFYRQSKASGQKQTYNQRRTASFQGCSTHRKPEQAPAKKD